MADITLKDRFGEQKVFSGVDTVVLNTTEDGVTQVFSKGVAVSGVEIVPDFSAGDMPVSAGEDILVKTAVIKKPETLLPDNIAEGVEVAGVVGTLSMQEVLENVPVELDFTGGNQTISAPEGYLIKTAVIQKPDTLTPSNIAKDVIIAGVVGTHEGGGGGGSSIKIASGRVHENGGNVVTINHNLGVVPDIVIFNSEVNGSEGNTIMGVGFSKAFKALIPEMVGYGTPWIYWVYRNPYGWGSRNTSDLGIDTATGSNYYEIIHSATNTTVTIGSNMYLPNSGFFHWVVIGGLT